MSLKNSNGTIGNRTRNLPVYGVVPEPLHHRAPQKKDILNDYFYIVLSVHNSSVSTILTKKCIQLSFNSQQNLCELNDNNTHLLVEILETERTLYEIKTCDKIMTL